MNKKTERYGSTNNKKRNCILHLSSIISFWLPASQTSSDITRTVPSRGARGAKPPLATFSPSPEKYVGHNLKILDIVQKIWALLGKLFAPPGVPSWLRAWILHSKILLSSFDDD